MNFCGGGWLKVSLRRAELPDSWLCIIRIRRCQWRCEQVLQEGPQTVSIFSSSFRSKSDKSASRWGERGCISCRAAPRNGALVMCRPCHDRALGVTPAIIEVPEDHEIYKSGMPTVPLSLSMRTDRSTVKTQFEQTWRHSTKCPEVRAVYKIVNTTASLDKYKQYLWGRLSLNATQIY